MEVKKETGADLTLNIADFIDSSNLKNFHSVYKNPAALKKQLQTQLLSPLLGPKEAPRKPAKERERLEEDDPLRVPTRNPRPYHHSWEDPSERFPYGAADLDPLRGHGGGMIFDPLHAERSRPRPDPLPGLPPGAVPPGARFDPFNPPGTGRRPGPDHDHLPPPGYDDMFM